MTLWENEVGILLNESVHWQEFPVGSSRSNLCRAASVSLLFQNHPNSSTLSMKTIDEELIAFLAELLL
jgi:hypothetical protein